jgi:chromosomal replication initiation ATPase DnaA
MADIVAEVAREYGVRPDEILGPRRFRHVTEARHEAMRRCRVTGRTSGQIARVFHRDHKTVLHGIARAEERRQDHG